MFTDFIQTQNISIPVLQGFHLFILIHAQHKMPNIKTTHPILKISCMWTHPHVFVPFAPFRLPVTLHQEYMKFQPTHLYLSSSQFVNAWLWWKQAVTTAGSYIAISESPNLTFSESFPLQFTNIPPKIPKNSSLFFSFIFSACYVKRLIIELLIWRHTCILQQVKDFIASWNPSIHTQIPARITGGTMRKRWLINTFTSRCMMEALCRHRHSEVCVRSTKCCRPGRLKLSCVVVMLPACASSNRHETCAVSMVHMRRYNQC